MVGIRGHLDTRLEWLPVNDGAVNYHGAYYVF